MADLTGLRAPEPLLASHDLTGFDCGEPSLDDWLRRRALTNQDRGATRTFVVCQQNAVIAYYALAAGAIRSADAPGRLRLNMPEPIPLIVLARLAVDRGSQGMGLGRALIGDLAARSSQAASLIGIRGIVVQAISESARTFYLAQGFVPSVFDPMMLLITLADIRMAGGS